MGEGLEPIYFYFYCPGLGLILATMDQEVREVSWANSASPKNATTSPTSHPRDPPQDAHSIVATCAQCSQHPGGPKLWSGAVLSGGGGAWPRAIAREDPAEQQDNRDGGGQHE